MGKGTKARYPKGTVSSTDEEYVLLSGSARRGLLLTLFKATRCFTLVRTDLKCCALPCSVPIIDQRF